MTIMLSNSDEGLRLAKLLMREFGVPEHARWFEVRFEVNEAVIVRCEYHPDVRPDVRWTDGVDDRPEST